MLNGRAPNKVYKFIIYYKAARNMKHYLDIWREEVLKY
jgi:hypothetical protein